MENKDKTPNEAHSDPLKPNRCYLYPKFNLTTMTCTEFKIRVSEVINFSNEAERKRYFKISNKELQRAGVDFKNISTDKEVKDGWWKFNKYQADWEAYCRKSKHEARMRKNDNYVDYSHLAYNGVADDF